MRPLETDLGHLAHPIRSHVGHVDARRERAQRVVGADVGGRLLSPDVLLARSKGQVEAAPALLVVSRSDQAAGEAPHQLFAAGDESGMRPAGTWAQTPRLALADPAVASPLP